jgi:hypothetical protein
MRTRHQITAQAANEALADPDALLYDPDPKSTSGQSARLIGYSPTAAAVLVVILVRREDRPGSRWAPTSGRRTVPTAGSTRKGPSAMSDPKQVVEQVASEADLTADQAMAPGAVFTRPNKSVTVATRLSPEDLAEIERLAGRLDVPPSSLIRGWILSGLNAHKDETVQSTIKKISADVQRLRELVA